MPLSTEPTFYVMLLQLSDAVTLVAYLQALFFSLEPLLYH